MSNNSKPAFNAVMDMLQDGLWHPVKKVIVKGMAAVPPGIAVRRAEASRVTRFKRDNPGIPVAPRKRNLDPDTLMRVGAREITYDVLTGGPFERQGDKIRLIPGRIYHEVNGRWMWDRKSATLNQSAEEAQLIRAERSRQSYRARLLKKGLDPDLPRIYELREQASMKWQALTPEERKVINKERSKRSWETRKAKEKDVSVSDHLRRGGQPVHDDVPDVERGHTGVERKNALAPDSAPEEGRTEHCD